MKRIGILICALCVCGFAHGDTATISWNNEDGTTYETSTCTIGGTLTIPSTPPTKRGYTFKGWLPEWTQIEYIQSTGTQYIDTGIIADEKTEAEVEFQDFQQVSGEQFLFGATSNAWSNRNFGINMSVTNSKILYYMNCDGYTSHSLVNSGNIKLSLTGIYLNGDKLSITRGAIPSASAFNTGYSITLFGEHLSSGVSYMSKYKLKYFKIWQDGALVRDMIPVLDKNNIPCMFDIVSGQYFYNAGTGSFTAGPVM